MFKKTAVQVALRVCNDLLLKCESKSAWFDFIEHLALHSDPTRIPVEDATSIS